MVSLFVLVPLTARHEVDRQKMEPLSVSRARPCDALREHEERQVLAHFLCKVSPFEISQVSLDDRFAAMKISGGWLGGGQSGSPLLTECRASCAVDAASVAGGGAESKGFSFPASTPWIAKVIALDKVRQPSHLLEVRIINSTFAKQVSSSRMKINGCRGYDEWCPWICESVSKHFRGWWNHLSISS